MRSTFNFLFVLLVFVLIACKSEQKVYGIDGKLLAVLSYKGGKMDGLSVWHHHNGRKSLEVEYKKNKKNGSFKKYSYLGACIETAFYKNDSLDGENKIFYEKGGIMIQRYFKMDKKDSNYYEYYPDGTFKIKGQYCDNQMDGKWEYFDQKGFPVGIGSFEKGTGSIQKFGYRGQLISELFYKKGEMIKENFFELNGQRVNLTYRYQNGKVVEILKMGDLRHGD